MSSIKDISTDIIELSGKTNDFSLSVPLVKPSDLIRLVRLNTVKFRQDSDTGKASYIKECAYMH